MNTRTLSVFVDESGVLHQSDDSSRFYLLTLVFHNQSNAIDTLADEFDASIRRLGIERMCFHAGPIIRQTDDFAILSWEFRAKIFSLMMGFVRKADFSYHTFIVDKKFANSSEQIVNEIERQFSTFWSCHPELREFDGIKVCYDCGQAPITNLLHRIFSPSFLPPVEFAQGVKPAQYKLFQVADLICSIILIEQKFAHQLAMSPSEHKFFGGPRNFKKNILRRIKAKEF